MYASIFIEYRIDGITQSKPQQVGFATGGFANEVCGVVLKQ